MENKDYIDIAYSLHKDMTANKFSLVYDGEITHDLTKVFVSLAENKMSKYSEDISVKKKVFHVMVECLQNLSKHAEYCESHENKDKYGNGIFIVGETNDKDSGYHIITGNPIDKKKVSELKSLLEKINNSDKAELKEMFKQQMKEGALSEKGGAGLGLIDIARKNGGNLEYSFVEIDSKSDFFILRTKISRNS